MKNPELIRDNFRHRTTSFYPDIIKLRTRLIVIDALGSGWDDTPRRIVKANVALFQDHPSIKTLSKRQGKKNKASVRLARTRDIYWDLR